MISFVRFSSSTTFSIWQPKERTTDARGHTCLHLKLATLPSKRTHRGSIRFVHADDGLGNITDVDVSVPIYGQTVFSSNADNNAIITNAVAVEIQDLNAYPLRIQNQNSAIAYGDLRRRCKLSAAIAMPVLAHTFQNLALQIEDKHEIAWGISQV